MTFWMTLDDEITKMMITKVQRNDNNDNVIIRTSPLRKNDQSPISIISVYIFLFTFHIF